MSKQNIAIIAVTLVIALGVIILGVRNRPNRAETSQPNPTPVANINPDTLLGIQTSQASSWQAEISHLGDRLAAIGLPALKAEGTILHIHQHLDLFIHGQKKEVPAGAGINELALFISPIHTHDTTGIMHIESPVVQTFTLGQFFDIWGVRLTANCIGGYCKEGDSALHVFIDGKEVTSDPRMIELKSHQEIVVAYGTQSEVSSPIPTQYAFPEGL